MRSIRFSAYCFPVNPTVTTSTIDAEPITIPSMVSKKRVLDARKLSIARLIVSRSAMVELALARVASKVWRSFGTGVGMGGVAVAILV